MMVNKIRSSLVSQTNLRNLSFFTFVRLFSLSSKGSCQKRPTTKILGGIRNIFTNFRRGGHINVTDFIVHIYQIYQFEGGGGVLILFPLICIFTFL